MDGRSIRTTQSDQPSWWYWCKGYKQKVSHSLFIHNCTFQYCCIFDRKSRNLSEKKRRDQFNILVNELSAMVTNNRKMDKTSVIKMAIQVIQANKGNDTCLNVPLTNWLMFWSMPVAALNAELKSHEIQEHWKPTFMSNNEFVHLMLEASMLHFTRWWSKCKAIVCQLPVYNNFRLLMDFSSLFQVQVVLFTCRTVSPHYLGIYL